MELSIVIPVYNEEENVEPLIQEINAALRPLGKPYEIVVVDDGSRDATFAVLARLQAMDPVSKANSGRESANRGMVSLIGFFPISGGREIRRPPDSA